MKKLLLILLMTNTSIFAGSLVVNFDDENGNGIYEVSDDGSEYTLVRDIDFGFTQVSTIVDNANGKIYFRRSTDPIPDPDNPEYFISYQYYVMYDVATDTFTGEYGDDLFNGFEQLGFDETFEELENGLLYSAISSTNNTAIENSTNILNNKTNIATNTTNIATNTAGIVANTTSIATNTTGIANNVVRLDNLGALAASNANRVEGLETLTGLMQNEYRSGIASSIALSQIQYAASGFSIGVGHGEFKNKDEMAVGIGYGGQFNEDVGFQFQFGSSGDSTGFGFTVNF